MRRFVAATILYGAVAVVALRAAQTPDVALCNGIAAKIRQNAEIAAGSDDDLLTLLSKGDHPYVELAREAEMSLVHSSEGLLAALKEAPGYGAHAVSLRDSDIHMIESVEGTANCASFQFFRLHRGGQMEGLPSPPPKGAYDGDNLICSGYGSNGYLARVAGSDAFVETITNATDDNYKFRVVPLQNGHWGTACEVDANFRSEYKISKIFVPTNGPVNEKAVEKVVAQIVERHAALSGTTSFSFGPRVPRRDEKRLRAMSELAAMMQGRGRNGVNKPEPVEMPAFGREKELAPFQKSLADVENYPLVLDGKTYLMTIGHCAIGWRVSHDSGLILYSLNAGKIEPVAAAIVSQSQGRLKFVRAAEWKFAS
jgi:hypothetical protein